MKSEKAQTKAIHAERRERDVLRTRVHVKKLIYMFPTRYTNTSRLEAAQRESERERKLALVKLISR